MKTPHDPIHAKSSAPGADTRSHGLSRRQVLKGLGASAAGLIAARSGYPLHVPGPASARPGQSIAPRVAIAKVTTYDLATVRQQVRDLIDSLGGLGDIVRPGDRVAIKVNLTGGSGATPLPGISPIESYVTHPAVVQALGELIRDAGAGSIYIVEGVAAYRTFFDWDYVPVADAIGARLINLNWSHPYESFAHVPVGDDWYIYPEFTFNALLQEVDTFVSIPKMKCHGICGVTHSMKNQVGLVPYSAYDTSPEDLNRSLLHGSDDEVRQRLPRVVVDLNRARPIHLALIDGIKTVEGGEGPWQPHLAPVEANVLIAGRNPVATDAVATAIMGFDPTASSPFAPFCMADNHLNLACEAGLGTNRLEEIATVGASIDEVVHPFNLNAPSETF